MVETRSKSKVLADKTKIPADKTIVSRDIPDKQVCEKWLTNPTVIDKALQIFGRHGYPKRCPDSASLLGFPLIFDIKREWETMPDTEKAPFISMALKDLVHDAETWKRVFKDENAKKESKASIKRKRDGIDYESQNIFCQEYCENHFKDHPNAKPSEVNDAAIKEWSSMTDAERAVYSNRCKKRWKELEKIYLRLLNDKAFKKFRKYI